MDQSTDNLLTYKSNSKHQLLPNPSNPLSIRQRHIDHLLSDDLFIVGDDTVNPFVFRRVSFHDCQRRRQKPTTSSPTTSTDIILIFCDPSSVLQAPAVDIKVSDSKVVDDGNNDELYPVFEGVMKITEAIRSLAEQAVGISRRIYRLYELVVTSPSPASPAVASNSSSTLTTTSTSKGTSGTQRNVKRW